MPTRGLNCCLHPLLDLADRNLLADAEDVVAQADVEHHPLVLPAVLDVGGALRVVVVVAGARRADLPVGVGLVGTIDLEVAHVVVHRLEPGLERVALDLLGQVDLAGVDLGLAVRVASG